MAHIIVSKFYSICQLCGERSAKRNKEIAKEYSTFKLSINGLIYIVQAAAKFLNCDLQFT